MYFHCLLVVQSVLPCFFTTGLGFTKIMFFALVVGWLNKQSQCFSLMLYVNGFAG
ncbi:hypothetical protein NC652_037630 [Populus alba x Populus x berolinensis]|nr:hypothetical protein NC652_037630 [Populus alba x Populus x berolinensis]